MPWQNQDIILFHGTTDAHARTIMDDGVDVALGEMDRDFGRGFYCTTLQEQASIWAQKKARRIGGSPAVLSLSISRDELAVLSTLAFVVGSADANDFWSFVEYCRNSYPPHGRKGSHPAYDVVFGPITFWRERRQMPNADQVSFHTIAAQSLLNKANRRSIV